MNDLFAPPSATLALPVMTEDEARETDRLIKRHINTTRYLLLDMRDRQGWKALGFESFGEYGKQSLGYEKAYLTQLADAGEISLQLGYDAQFAMANSVPKERHLRPLAAVPAESRREVWEAANATANEAGEKLKAQHVADAVAEWKQRANEWRDQALAAGKAVKQLEMDVLNLKAGAPAAPVTVTVTVPPDDYAQLQAAVAAAGGVEAIEARAAKAELEARNAKATAKAAKADAQVAADINAARKALDQALDQAGAALTFAVAAITDAVFQAQEASALPRVFPSTVQRLPRLQVAAENLLEQIAVLVAVAQKQELADTVVSEPVMTCLPMAAGFHH